MDIHLDIFGYHRIYSGYLLWICDGYLKWIFHLDKHGYPRICLGYVSKDISHGYVAWISLDMSGYLLDISSRYLFLDTSERYPILPKDIQEISFHILSYPTISRHIQPYPEISKWGELPDGVWHMSKGRGLRSGFSGFISCHCVQSVIYSSIFCPFYDLLFVLGFFFHPGCRNLKIQNFA
jgi:hypothetical protein